MPEAKPRKDQFGRGVLAAMSAFFMFALMNAFAKVLSATHSVIEIGFYRNLIAITPFLVVVFVFKHRDLLTIRTQPYLIVGRAALGVLSLLATFGAYSLMPMAETSVILFTSSFFLPILGFLLLGEKVGVPRWLAILVGFAGVAIIANPQGDLQILGVLLALGAALAQAVMAVTLRHLGRFERPETISFYFFLVGIVITAPAMPFVASTLTWKEIPLIIGVGLSGALAQWLYTIALKNLPTALVAVFNYTTIIWATILGWLIWNDWPMPAVIVGGIFIIAANALIIVRTSRANRNG